MIREARRLLAAAVAAMIFFSPEFEATRAFAMSVGQSGSTGGGGAPERAAGAGGGTFSLNQPGGVSGGFPRKLAPFDTPFKVSAAPMPAAAVNGVSGLGAAPADFEETGVADGKGVRPFADSSVEILMGQNHFQGNLPTPLPVFGVSRPGRRFSREERPSADGFRPKISYRVSRAIARGLAAIGAGSGEPFPVAGPALARRLIREAAAKGKKNFIVNLDGELSSGKLSEETVSALETAIAGRNLIVVLSDLRGGEIDLGRALPPDVLKSIYFINTRTGTRFTFGNSKTLPVALPAEQRSSDDRAWGTYFGVLFDRVRGRLRSMDAYIATASDLPPLQGGYHLYLSHVRGIEDTDKAVQALRDVFGSVDLKLDIRPPLGPDARGSQRIDFSFVSRGSSVASHLKRLGATVQNAVYLSDFHLDPNVLLALPEVLTLVSQSHRDFWIMPKGFISDVLREAGPEARARREAAARRSRSVVIGAAITAALAGGASHFPHSWTDFLASLKGRLGLDRWAGWHQQSIGALILGFLLRHLWLRRRSGEAPAAQPEAEGRRVGEPILPLTTEFLPGRYLLESGAPGNRGMAEFQIGSDREFHAKLRLSGTNPYAADVDGRWQFANGEFFGEGRDSRGDYLRIRLDLRGISRGRWREGGGAVSLHFRGRAWRHDLRYSLRAKPAGRDDFLDRMIPGHYTSKTEDSSDVSEARSLEMNPDGTFVSRASVQRGFSWFRWTSPQTVAGRWQKRGDSVVGIDRRGREAFEIRRDVFLDSRLGNGGVRVQWLEEGEDAGRFYLMTRNS